MFSMRLSFLALMFWCGVGRTGSIVTTCEDCDVQSFEQFSRFSLLQSFAPEKSVSVAVADVNDDLFPDVLVFREGGVPKLYRNKGDGTGNFFNETSTIVLASPSLSFRRLLA